MSNELMVQIEAAQAHNQQLLALAEQQEWSRFSESLEGYTSVLTALCSEDFKTLEGTHRTKVAVRFGASSHRRWIAQKVYSATHGELATGYRRHPTFS
jgi:hypothetical protein